MLYKFVDGPCPILPRNTEEITLAFERIARAGLANIPESVDNEEVLHRTSPAEPIKKLSPTDPRAIDFRNQLRNWCVPDPCTDDS